MSETTCACGRRLLAFYVCTYCRKEAADCRCVSRPVAEPGRSSP